VPEGCNVTALCSTGERHLKPPLCKGCPAARRFSSARRGAFILGSTAQFCVLDHRAGRADPLREKRSCTLCVSTSIFDFQQAGGAPWSARRRANCKMRIVRCCPCLFRSGSGSQAEQQPHEVHHEATQNRIEPLENHHVHILLSSGMFPCILPKLIPPCSIADTGRPVHRSPAFPIKKRRKKRRAAPGLPVALPAACFKISY
jgi:hypothetical protein